MTATPAAARPTRLKVLQDIRVASPCTASWEAMSGDDRKRFCHKCGLHVYDLSELSGEEILELIETTEGRLCGRLHRRADGTIITRDCPVGLRAARRALVRVVGCVAAIALFALGFFGCIRGGSRTAASITDVEPFKSIWRWVDRTPPAALGEVVMGDIACPLPPPPPPPLPATNAE